RVVGQDGKPLSVTRVNLDHTKLAAAEDGSLTLHLRHSYGRQDLRGDRAARALATLLARANGGGGSTGKIADAAELIADAGDPQRAIVRVAREAERRTGDFEERAAAVARGPHARTFGEAMEAQMVIQAR